MLNNFKIKFTICAWLLFTIGAILYSQPKALADESNLENESNIEIEFIQPTESNNIPSLEPIEIDDYSEIIDNADIEIKDKDTILNDILDSVVQIVPDNLPDGITGIIAGLKGIIDDFVSSEIPDIDKIIEIVSNSGSEEALPSKKQSENLEGNPDSYSIAESESDAIVREILVETVKASTFDEAAQKKLKETVMFVETNVDESIDLGQNSQGKDVTQQILQNISQQEAISATTQGIIAQQNQQAQIDRAINNMLNAQQAEELSAMNDTKRREELGTTNLTVRQWGLIRLPGQTTEDEDS
ncbi:MAG: hypothetical protein AB4372_05995 [Xenococcus sp. (in: cyanobacteria)]